MNQDISNTEYSKIKFMLQLTEGLAFHIAGLQKGDCIVACNDIVVHDTSVVKTVAKQHASFTVHIARSTDTLYGQLSREELNITRSEVESLLVNQVIMQYKEKGRGVYAKRGVLDSAALQFQFEKADQEDQLNQAALRLAYEQSEYPSVEITTILGNIRDKIFSTSKTINFPLQTSQLRKYNLSMTEFNMLHYFTFICTILSSKHAHRCFERYIYLRKF